MFKNENDKVPRIPSSWIPILKVFLLGALYLGIQNVAAGFFPSSLLKSKEWFNDFTFLQRLVYIWIICKIALTKYIGVWLLGEGPCTLVGINFAGWNKDGSVKGWKLLSNVNPWLFETSLNLQGIVEAFNINTNDWVKRYVFKRLMFLGNRNISALSALMFLAIWHGFSAGYFLCFFLEFLDMEAEKRLKRFNDPVYKFFSTHSEMVVLKYCYSLLCFIVRSFALHYGMISFEVKTLSKTFAVYNSVYWIGHVALLIIFLLDVLLPHRREPKDTQKVTAKKEL